MKYNSQASSLKQNYSRINAESKSVRFDTVQVNSHAVILGNNPAVSAGLPVTIEWVAFETEVVSVEDYEGGKAVVARKRNEMIIPLHLREDMVRLAGYCRAEMLAVNVEMAKIRKNRAASARQAAGEEKWQKLVSFRAFTRRTC
jgi:hypothetical protein